MTPAYAANWPHALSRQLQDYALCGKYSCQYSYLVDNTHGNMVGSARVQKGGRESQLRVLDGSHADASIARLMFSSQRTRAYKQNAAGRPHAFGRNFKSMPYGAKEYILLLFTSSSCRRMISLEKRTWMLMCRQQDAADRHHALSRKLQEYALCRQYANKKAPSYNPSQHQMLRRC